jgi:putative aminopeptidase FrvX
MPVKKQEIKVKYALLEALCKVQAPSGSESTMKEFLLSYIKKNSKHWKYKPVVVAGNDLQDCIILKFGKPSTAIYAHMDSVGFTVRYDNQLVPIGSPDAPAGTYLVGEDSTGAIRCKLQYDHENHALFEFGRTIDRGTTLTYEVNFKEEKDFIQSAYLDNRLGILNALHVAETLKDGLIIFSCWEEHGGGAVPYLAKIMFEKYKVKQALISDITWVTDGVHHGKGVVVSLRDRNLPRKTFLNQITKLAAQSKIPFQLEVEGVGSSDGRELQLSPYPIDWCFIGAPEEGAHSPTERVHKKDIEAMIYLYRYLMEKL